MTDTTAQQHFLALALEVLVGEFLFGGLSSLDLLRKIDFVLGGEQLIFANGGEVLGDQIGREAAPLVGELALVTVAADAIQCVAIDSLLGLFPLLDRSVERLVTRFCRHCRTVLQPCTER